MTETKTPLDADLERRSTKAFALIDSRLADARAHAERGGSLPTAQARLLELETALVGQLRDARAHFYQRSFALHRAAGLDPGIHQVDLQPTAEGERAARDAQIFGRDLGFEVRDLVADAGASLTSTALASSVPNAPAAANRALWSTWESEHHQRLVGLSRRELSTAQIAIFEAIGRIFIRPELR